MYKIDKADIGKESYFYEPAVIGGDDAYVIYRGVLFNIMPKYNFTDACSSQYEREKNYLFRVEMARNSYIVKVINTPKVVFETFNEVYFTRETNCFFNYSVLATKI